MVLETGNIERDRLIQVWILPALLGAAVAAVLRLALGMLWQAAAVSQDMLNPQVIERALEDALYYERVVAQVRRILNVMLTVVTLVGWVSAVGWFARCWKTRIAQVGTVERGRAAWLWIGVGGLLAGYAAAGYVVWDASLSSLVTSNAVLANVLFVGPFYCLTYWAISVLSTHEIYVPAIPWSTWRT